MKKVRFILQVAIFTVFMAIVVFGGAFGVFALMLKTHPDAMHNLEEAYEYVETIETENIEVEDIIVETIEVNGIEVKGL